MERLNGLYNGGTCFDGLHDGGWERLGGLHNEEERFDDLHDGPWWAVHKYTASTSIIQPLRQLYSLYVNYTASTEVLAGPTPVHRSLIASRTVKSSRWFFLINSGK